MMDGSKPKTPASDRAPRSSLFQRPSNIKSGPSASTPIDSKYFNRKKPTLAEITAQNEERRRARHALKAGKQRSSSANEHSCGGDEDSPPAKKRRLTGSDLSDSLSSSSSGSEDNDAIQQDYQDPEEEASDDEAGSENPDHRASAKVRKSGQNASHPESHGSSRKPKTSPREPLPSRAQEPSSRTETEASPSHPSTNESSGSRNQLGTSGIKSEAPEVKSEVAPATAPDNLTHSDRAVTSDHQLLEDDDLKMEDLEAEFPELVRRAREKNKLKQSQQSNNSPSNRQDGDSFIAGPDSSGPTQQETPPIDPIVHILVWSTLENSHQLSFAVRLRQTLKNVRRSWCRRHQVHPEDEKSMILVWNGMRLWDTSTIEGLGFEIRENDDAYLRGKYHVPEDGNNIVVLEAMTKEMFQQRNSTPKKPDENDEPEYQDSSPKKKEPGIDVVLKAKSYPNCPMLVKSTTTVSEMLSAFRENNSGIPSDKTLVMIFDGEQLGSGQTIAELDLDGGESLEVHLR